MTTDVLAAGPGALIAGPLVLAAPVALAAGLVSFFSPCTLPLLPGYLSYVAGLAGSEVGEVAAPQRRGASRTVIGTMLFVLGFAALFSGYGALFGGLAALLLGHQSVLVRVLGAATIVLGLLFAGAFDRLPFAGRTVCVSFRPRLGLAGAPVLGVVFGLGWTPCIGPTLAAVLTLAAGSGTAARGAVLSFVYSFGLGLPFLLAAAWLPHLMRVFSLARRHGRVIMRAGGALLVLVGVLQVTGVWGTLIASLQGLIGGYQLPL
ncbi:MAG: cytochrome c biogenesis CcdA family protein [Sciscionella sp.]